MFGAKRNPKDKCHVSMYLYMYYNIYLHNERLFGFCLSFSTVYLCVSVCFFFVFLFPSYCRRRSRPSLRSSDVGRRNNSCAPDSLFAQYVCRLYAHAPVAQSGYTCLYTGRFAREHRSAIIIAPHSRQLRSSNNVLSIYAAFGMNDDK